MTSQSVGAGLREKVAETRRSTTAWALAGKKTKEKVSQGQTEKGGESVEGNKARRQERWYWVKERSTG